MVAVQEDFALVDDENARAEGVSVQRAHVTEVMETSQAIGDV